MRHLVLILTIFALVACKFTTGDNTPSHDNMKLNPEMTEARMIHDQGVKLYNEGLPAQAKVCWEKAAEQGFARSQNELGLLYQDGEGVEQDIDKAAYWFEKAAQQGHSGAMNNLAAVYFEKEEYEKAIPWFQKSADLGFVEAMFNLAMCYEQGYGVDKDIDKAKELLQKAADKGDLQSAIHLKNL